MTLLELLRQELPKRGGWPEGAVCFVQDIDGFVAGYKRKPMSGHNGIWDGDGYLNDSGWWSKMLARDRETEIVTREQYEATDCDFRPLRTEAERAIDEMVRLSGVSIGAAKILYDAGYRKG